MNPYESPLTIDTPPPVAQEVPFLAVNYKVLAEATEECSRAGKFYFLTILLAAGLLLGANLIELPSWGNFWRLVCAASFLASVFFFVIGIVLNVAACRQMKLELPDSTLGKLYARCQRASLLKGALLVYLSCVPVVSTVGGQPSGNAGLWNMFMVVVPAIVLLINSVVTVILHFRGINELGELLETPVADRWASLYLFSGLPATILTLVVVFFVQINEAYRSAPPVLCVLFPLLLLPMFYAYMQAYRGLSEAFSVQGKKA